MRLGFSVKVLGRPGMKSHDSRRWQNNPHLSVSLAYLRDILEYLKQQDVRMYRMSSELAPYITHPDLPAFHNQIDECATELALVGQMAQDAGLRLTFHPLAHIVLSTPDPDLAARSTDELVALARMADTMELSRECVIVVHVGGAYDDKTAAAARFVQRFMQLPAFVCRRLALEHDDTLFSLTDVHHIHERTGIPLVFDYLHFRCHNPERLALVDALQTALETWPAGVRPKVHFSSPRTEMRIIHRSDPETGDGRDVVRPPLPTQHADFVHPFEFASFLRAADTVRPFDIMLELKAKDLALLRLRDNLERFAPELAWRFEVEPAHRLRESEQVWSIEHVMDEDEPARVLVAVMNNERDLRIAREQGWYRIPLKRAPRQVAADFLAFYQTAAFTEEKWAVNYIAPIRRYRIARRRDLLPQEADHPRADDVYYKVEIGPLERLPAPVPSRRLRRITFIATTLERLLSATEINDLWMGGVSEEELWAVFREEPGERLNESERIEEQGSEGAA